MRTVLLAFILMGPLSAADWGPLQYLVGSWIGEGDGSPGKGSGGFSFSEDLQGKILVRRNFADYPAQGGKPAFRHDDLMIVYRDADGKTLRAMYFDNEGHTIPYLVDAGANSAVFTSEGARDTTRFRFTYTRAPNGGPDSVKIKFEIAPPGKDLAVYIEAVAHRAAGK